MAMNVTRRDLLAGAGAAALLSGGPARAAAPREITWDDLIPPGVPYAEMLSEPDLDRHEEVVLPKFDENARVYVQDLDGERVKMPGYIVPLDYEGDGVTTFIFAPYKGACIHVPPPPPNQLIYAETGEPYPSEKVLDAVWITGVLHVHERTTELAEIGYEMQVEQIEIYDWFAD